VALRPSTTRVGRAALAGAAVAVLGLAAAAPASAQFAFSTYITHGDANAGWIDEPSPPPGATEQKSIQLTVNGTSPQDFDDAARALFTGFPGTAPNQPPSFYFRTATAGVSGGSVRLVVRFSDDGRGELRPITLPSDVWTFVNGSGNDWDNVGGSCGGQLQRTYAQILACHPGATVTGVEVVNDSGWLFPGGFTMLVDNVSYGGETVSGPAPPVLGEAVTLSQLSGQVIVRVPQSLLQEAPPGVTGPGNIAQLRGTSSLQVGSVVNSTEGRVRLNSIGRQRRNQAAKFSQGTFRIRQPADELGLTELVLRGRLDCPGTRGARASGVTAESSRRRRRRLWGSGSGSYRTRGSYSSGSVRGTKWLTIDRCDGTLTIVRDGIVSVRDWGHGKTVLVHAGERYFASASGPFSRP